ncbi:SRPBCC family protein [Nocardioides sp. NPDC057772]|uniref:SRPBCC family protein n=1 Tax=Nocardioides sp. NPDC057772 TaxID=3346245 RepID=UPI003672B2A2
MAGETREKTDKAPTGLLSQLPVDRLRAEARGLGHALGTHGLNKIGHGVESLTQRLTDFADGKPAKKGTKQVKTGAMKAGAKAAVGKVKQPVEKVKDTAVQVKDTVGHAAGGLRKGEKNGGKKLKVTNIVESIDVPVSREVAYEQWTRFEEFPTFMKKVENVKQEEDEVVTWQAQVFWSHRTWKATIHDQVPNEHIVWTSESEKGRVDGAVTFHELAPNLTRILVTLEYHPKGLFEHTGNLWRAQGRRVRLEMAHFRRHVANHTLLHRDEIEGWTGEIHDQQVVDSDAGDDAEDDTEEDAETDTETDTQQKPRTSSTNSRSSSGRSTNSAPAKKSAAKKTTTRKTAHRPAKKTASKRSASKRTSSSSSSTGS